MLGSTSERSVPSTVTPSTAAERESRKTVEVLEELLTQSIFLRDLYKNARCRTSDIHWRRLHQLFDGHYREQIHLVDVLIDRIREAGGASRVSAGDFLHGTQFYQSPPGRGSNARLLRELVEAHELVLSAAQPAGTNDVRGDRSWARDFAVGHVVLINEQQLLMLSEHLMDRETHQRLQVYASGSE